MRRLQRVARWLAPLGPAAVALHAAFAGDALWAVASGCVVVAQLALAVRRRRPLRIPRRRSPLVIPGPGAR